MRADYGAREDVRRLRRLGWAMTAPVLFGALLALAWQIAQVSERRAQEATGEHLAASLNALVAERLARGQALEPAWRTGNPFVLLRWQQDNYCGELAAGEPARRGCWYWLPARAWLLYRARFAGGWTAGTNEVRAYRVQAISAARPAGPGTAFALELQAVPAAELAALAWISD